MPSFKLAFSPAAENIFTSTQALGIKVYAYWRMTKHIHLVLGAGGKSEGIELLMKRLAGRQTEYVNKLEGSYSISPIDTRSYLINATGMLSLIQ